MVDVASHTETTMTTATKKIWDCLSGTPLTFSQIQQLTGVKFATIDEVTARLEKQGHIKVTRGTYPAPVTVTR